MALLREIYYHIRYFPVLILYWTCPEELRAVIREDYCQAEYTRFIDAFVGNCGFRNLFYCRVQHGVLYGVCKKIAPYWPQIEIGINDGIGKGLVIYHNRGANINARSIGEYCYVYQGVTIGKGRQTKLGIRPVIGSHVRICTNAVVVGGIRIGDNSTIGAGAVVVHDVPPNAVVGGVPAKVLYYRDEKESDSYSKE